MKQLLKHKELKFNLDFDYLLDQSKQTRTLKPLKWKNERLEECRVGSPELKSGSAVERSPEPPGITVAVVGNIGRRSKAVGNERAAVRVR